MESDVRIIKKYPNRRLYDTEDSCYIKLLEIKDMIERGIPIKVIDSNTEEEITRSILLQIILEQESNKEPLFSTDNLINFIRYNGETSREGFMHFMDKNLNFFQEQQNTMKERFKEFADYNPMDFWTTSTKKNMDIWKKMQENFMTPGSETSPDSDKKEK
ncbi:hypothetical protein GCM10009133_11060 [Cocleimonas flava]|jgi:polyhydroxyalkanoate synthesis repressor PhaR|uniref:Polyhydroxyalkanoate synthesis repressor PhaR n=1 Tax=Cocleimonas flava TaxID=634765 RepID=A0A4R1EZX6_9GAMM|nr:MULTISPECIES: polyhydroxyalkanoate synthesis repressor PhaR [Cocleimonas]MEB8434433.1 polyhydroxyalkanoate synthesis repressor PhaR [Cocleimonas sp. KMM 6892]MEC4717326.1 polyhydroxyalkanoate synthesis repressor PhaR [Cocleimonas sp. KMM 6895]MEC4746705.1 polyhydroxyalkanoate synthesis repressor PhaR [Cocleimonas sp. KMM 6896]TCJ87467.1 polyhydroxyalkanoate synthesis repressor PhaR [Cocleimonas flava]